MSTFSYENKWGESISFDFGIDNMVIREIWIGDITRVIKFKYSDINDYRIFPSSGGYYKLWFSTKNKEIEVKENEKVSNTSFVSVTVKVKMEDSILSSYTKIFEDGEDSIRRVIYNNTPLRSPLDKLINKANDINQLYQDTPEEKFGMVYLNGLKKDGENYTIYINDAAILNVYTQKNQILLQDAEKYYEHPAKLQWIDHNTLAFKIPYGNWNIRYTFDTIVYSSVDSIGMGVTEGPKGVDIEVNDMHREVKLKLKKGLFRNKIVEIKEISKF